MSDRKYPDKLPVVHVHVGKPMTIVPGQVLLVVAGVAVGVFTGNPNVPVLREGLEPADEHGGPPPMAAERLPSRATKAVVRKQGGGGRQRYLTTGKRPIPGAHATLRVMWPMITARASGITRDEMVTALIAAGCIQSSQAWQYRDAIAWLAYNGYITADGPRSRHRMYKWTGKRLNTDTFTEDTADVA